MILPVHRLVRTHVEATVARLYGLDGTAMPAIVMQYPPKRALGDLAVPVAFELARTLRKSPRLIAHEIAAATGEIEGVARVEATASGYLNFYLNRTAFLTDRLSSTDRGAGTTETKAIVEHTAINPNKAAHIGHLRNAALGDTLCRLLRFQGVKVETQNYIDDTGVQVADVVVAFRELERRNLDGVRRIADTTRFDYYCWDLYARVTEWYEADRERLKIRAAALHDIERGENESAEIARFVAARIVACHLSTMARMNVAYDLLAWESHILKLQFWARAFEILKTAGAIFLQTEGRLAGCWVMRIGGEDETEPADADVLAGDDEDDERQEKVIVRSDGTVTYIGKDIAYQFWKFGLLGRDFHYRVHGRRPDGGLLWSTSVEPLPPEQDVVKSPSFGGADTTYNVIDTRQAHLQRLLKQALLAMGHSRQAEQSIHFSYGMVALSHRTASQLGYSTGEDSGRPFVEVSGRKGLGVKADDLLDRLTERALEEVAKRNAELTADESRQLAVMIATAAVRYFLIKYTRGRVIAFDVDEALNFEGETGPYLQYAVVRANNIFAKLRMRERIDERDLPRLLTQTPAATLETGEEGDDLWALVLEAARLDEVVDQAVRTLEMSVLAKHAFAMAQAFNAFYHRYPVLNEERVDARLWRAAVVSYFRVQMQRALDLMGFGVPSRM